MIQALIFSPIAYVKKLLLRIGLFQNGSENLKVYPPNLGLNEDVLELIFRYGVIIDQDQS